jgi:hypothetical protein
MSAPLIALAGTGGSGGGGGGGDVPNPLAWYDIYGIGSGATQELTVTGISVAISISAAQAGTGHLSYILNGVTSSYTGQFLANVNDTLAWLVTTGVAARSGTITVSNLTAGGTVLRVINYALSGSL